MCVWRAHHWNGSTYILYGVDAWQRLRKTGKMCFQRKYLFRQGSNGICIESFRSHVVFFLVLSILLGFLVLLLLFDVLLLHTYRVYICGAFIVICARASYTQCMPVFRSSFQKRNSQVCPDMRQHQHHEHIRVTTIRNVCYNIRETLKYTTEYWATTALTTREHTQTHSYNNNNRSALE